MQSVMPLCYLFLSVQAQGLNMRNVFRTATNITNPVLTYITFVSNATGYAAPEPVTAVHFLSNCNTSFYPVFVAFNVVKFKLATMQPMCLERRPNPSRLLLHRSLCSPTTQGPISASTVLHSSPLLGRCPTVGLSPTWLHRVVL